MTSAGQDEEVLLSHVWSDEDDDESDDLYFIEERNQRKDNHSKARRYCCYAIWTVVGVLTAVVVLYIAAHTISRNSVHVHTDCGFVKGVKVDGAYEFKGIPYAVPPLGELRWREPVSLKESKSCWKGVYSAKEYGSACVQQDVISKNLTGSEDCLYLNVWTPTVNSSLSLPVGVYIHGGSLIFLSGNVPNYHPTAALAAKGEMVFVSFNYRLNAFGFMALDILSQDSVTNTSGNFGFYDQVMALRWVQNNIHYFGGDPNRVTLMGQSSGGTSVLAHLVSPLTKGLFQRAWLMSSSIILNKTLEDASRDNLVFLEKTGCQDVACLRTLSADKIVNSVPWDVYPYWSDSDITDLPQKNLFIGAKPIVDGILIPAPPDEMWKNGLGHDIPIVIGSTSQELDFNPLQQDIRNWDWDKYEEVVSEKLNTFGGDITQTAKQLYQYVPKLHTPELAYTTMASDIRVTCPTNTLAKTISDGVSSPVYRYVATSWPSQPVEWYPGLFKPRYGFHMWDCYALFGTYKNLVKEPSESDVKFSELMQQMYFHFAREGVMFPEWPEYPGSIAKISSNLKIVDSYKKRECDFWDIHGFASYALIN